MAKLLINGSLSVSAPLTPLDDRTEVNTVEEILTKIVYPNPGSLVFVKSTGDLYIILKTVDKIIPSTGMVQYPNYRVASDGYMLLSDYLALKAEDNGIVATVCSELPEGFDF